MLNAKELENIFSSSLLCDLYFNEFIFGSTRKIIGAILIFDDFRLISIRLDDCGVGFIFEEKIPNELKMGKYGFTKIKSVKSYFQDIELPALIRSIDVRDHVDSYDDCGIGLNPIKIHLAGEWEIRILNRDDEMIVQISRNGKIKGMTLPER